MFETVTEAEKNCGTNHGLKSDVRGTVPLKDGEIKMKTSDQDECVLCCREISIYAVGACDHPVCYICSARMRVLCETNECPICRSDMPLVICTWKRKPYFEISKKFSFIDKNFQITFENLEIQESFQLLLENKCPECDEKFLTFNKLRDHVRRVHSLQYCELCAENLKLFPFERKIYDRKDLARHKRIGDPDDTSHRGHPLCEFCDQRYVDSDELFRHLRREHYFCHFCDADGKNQFYEDYNYLRTHFRKDHYLCEEGDCVNEQFTGAFRTEIDLKAHTAIHHSKNKSKAEARQARTLELEFNFAPHSRSNVNSSPRGNRFNHKRQNPEERNSRENRPSQQAETEKIDTQSTLEFPYLSEDGESSNAVPKSNLNSMTLQSFSRNTVPQRQKESMSFDDFPALVSTTVSVSSEVTNNQSRKFNFSIRQQNNMAGKAPNVSIHLAQKNVHPRTSESGNKEIANKKQTPTWISKKDNSNFEDEFPKLETKKNPVTYTNIVNTTVVNNVQSKSQPTVEIVSSSQSEGDQFLYIKSKSRKKKNKTAHEDKTSENADDTDVSSASYCSLLNNNSSSLCDQDPDEKYKKNLLRPSPKTNFVPEESWHQKVTFGKDDFPPLAPSEPVRKPPGLGNKVKKPPPGFNFSSNSCGNSAPLNISLSSIARQLVSTNENKNIDPVIPHSDFKYKQPLNFHKRNEDLKNKIVNLSVFDDFRTKSGKFRQNEITAVTYYSECLKMLGEKDFMDIFPELICLLPDINKQQELFDVHKKHQNDCGAVPKQKLENNKIRVCDICYQVLMEFDHANHVSQHEKEN